MTFLKRLVRGGHKLIDEPFLRGERRLESDQLAPYLEDTEIDLDLTPVTTAIGEVISSKERYDDGIDKAIAPLLHASMVLTRRQASDMGMWQYLAIALYPSFVWHRWEYTTRKAMLEKFLGEGSSNIYAHALHRLWWMAELTYNEPHDYSLTTRVLGFQQLANKIFDRRFARYKPASVACAQVLLDEDVPAPIVDAVTLRFRQILTTVQLEALEQTEIKSIVQGLVDEAKETRMKGR